MCVCVCLLVNVILIVLVFGKIDGIGANFTNERGRERGYVMLLVLIAALHCCCFIFNFSSLEKRFPFSERIYISADEHFYCMHREIIIIIRKVQRGCALCSVHAKTISTASESKIGYL